MFRSDLGADAFLELHSIVETAKKHKNKRLIMLWRCVKMELTGVSRSAPELSAVNGQMLCCLFSDYCPLTTDGRQTV